MQSLRRLTAVVLNVLVIQVSLAGYGAACAQPDNAVGSATSGAMAMTHAAGASHETQRARVGHMAGEDCSLPWAPEGCAALTACVPPAIPAGTNVAFADAPPTDHGWADPALGRLAPRPAPDLPPPRA